jgi:DUF971 family protein
MSGLDRKTPIPTEITLHKKSRVLELGFEDGTRYQLPAEFLRVYSPSAEVRGHGPARKRCRPASATSRSRSSKPSAITP